MELANSYPNDFRVYLQEELLRRIKKNSSYSMRSFANLLDVNSGSLSRYISGKRNLSETKIRDWCYRLGVDLEQTEVFCEMDREIKKPKRKDLDLAMDTFKAISDWYHFAILELIKTQDFKADAKWISSRLGITAAEARLGLERLIRLEFVKEDDDGSLVVGSTNFSTLSHKNTNLALRNLQKEILEKGIDALEETSVDKRLQTTITVAVNTKKLDVIKEKILNFQSELNEYIESMNNCDEVYHISFTSYPVTKTKNEK